MDKSCLNWTRTFRRGICYGEAKETIGDEGSKPVSDGVDGELEGEEDGEGKIQLPHRPWNAKSFPLIVDGPCFKMQDLLAKKVNQIESE